jgi:hypothetical protein
VYLTWHVSASCGEYGAERGSGRGPWTVAESLSEGVGKSGLDGSEGGSSSR